GRRKSCAECSHVACKYKEIISEYVKNTAGENCACCQSRILVISQICRQHLIKQEKRNRKLDRQNIFSCQSQCVVLRSEQNQQVTVKENNNQPYDRRKNHRSDYRYCKIFI